MITQVKVGQNYINVSVAITNNSGQRIDPTSAEAQFYKISQIDGSLNLDTNIGGTGIVTLVKQGAQIGFYGASINISSFSETEYVIFYKIVAQLAETITVEYLSIDLSKKQIGEIKTDTTSIISILSTLVTNIWTYGTRTLTSFGTLVVDITTSVWGAVTRTLTACVKGTEIDAIKERTDNLPDDPASETGSLAKDSTVAKETTLNSKSSQTSVDAIKTDTESILTFLSTLIVNIWSYTTRTLTSFGTLVVNIAGAVWDELTASHTLPNTFGYMFIHINSTVAAINSLLESVSNTLNTVEYYCENMADIIWSNSTRTLTSFGTLVASIWSYGTRTLTSYGTLVNDIATAVWTYITRTITAGGITAAEVWAYITRTLTAGTKDAEIDAIKIQTDKIKYILGLSMENHRIFSPVYDANNCLTSATIKIYPTKADVLADTNAIAIYAMVATFDSEGKCLTYRMTKES